MPAANAATAVRDGGGGGSPLDRIDKAKIRPASRFSSGDNLIWTPMMCYTPKRRRKREWPKVSGIRGENGEVESQKVTRRTVYHINPIAR